MGEHSRRCISYAWTRCWNLDCAIAGSALLCTEATTITTDTTFALICLDSGEIAGLSRLSWCRVGSEVAVVESRHVCGCAVEYVMSIKKLMFNAEICDAYEVSIRDTTCRLKILRINKQKTSSERQLEGKVEVEWDDLSGKASGKSTGHQGSFISSSCPHSKPTTCLLTLRVASPSAVSATKLLPSCPNDILRCQVVPGTTPPSCGIRGTPMSSVSSIYSRSRDRADIRVHTSTRKGHVVRRYCGDNFEDGIAQLF